MIDYKNKTYFLGGKMIGYTVTDSWGKEILVTPKNKKHFYKKIVGFCFNKEMLDHAFDNNVNTVKVLYTKVDGSKEVFSMSLWSLIFYHKTIKEEGYEEQYSVPMESFKKEAVL